MAVVLVLQEDGDPVDGANAYADRDFAEPFLENSGNPAEWEDADASARDAALIVSSLWHDTNFDWVGIPNSESINRMFWPRSYAYTSTGLDYSEVIPDCLKRSVCFGAVYHLQGSLIAPLERGGRINRAKLGPLEVEYAPGAPGSTTYPLLDRLLGPIVKGTISGSERRMQRS